ncbi:MAG: hypothetical protein ACOCXH_12855 [Cyclobacteriaceae bacterium]
MEKKKECPSCAMETERAAEKCPVCGYEFPGNNPINKWISILLILVFLLSLFFILS